MSAETLNLFQLFRDIVKSKPLNFVFALCFNTIFNYICNQFISYKNETTTTLMLLSNITTKGQHLFVCVIIKSEIQP